MSVQTILRCFRLIKIGYFGFLKIYLFKILPINDNFLQDLSTFLIDVYIKTFPHLLKIVNYFKLHLLANRGVMG